MPPGAWHVVLDVAAVRAVAQDPSLHRRVCDHVDARRLDIDASPGLRELALVSSGGTPREQHRQQIRVRRVPCRLVGEASEAARDEAAELAATFAVGGATTLVSVEIARAPEVPAGVRVVALDDLVAYVEAAEHR